MVEVDKLKLGFFFRPVNTCYSDILKEQLHRKESF